MADPIISNETPHDEAEALLPWYATGRLDGRDRARVEQHIATCAHCREELGLERRLAQGFRSYAPEVESGWSRLRDRVASRPNKTAPQRRLADLGAELWAGFTRPVVVALASIQVAFVALASGLLMWLSQPVYEGLGSASAPAAANAIIMFRSDATEGQMRRTMAAAGARIVDGPTSAGAYLLHIDPLKRDAWLARLRTDRDVQLAERIDSGRPS